ncbi:hypothetical protein DICVIV_10761 [Dictyocaulus viviparus]|uniref:NTR domain-containing protein n=1 Tax=Dictyocaulus viviparus TaxID=29172 RepID=A0A0D8XF19_DICVI|nr:hypothetical protein DICVIV_10761 [Dictyocaulus viviparus]
MMDISACKCSLRPSEETFCGADWVAHVKVLKKKISPGGGMSDVGYEFKPLKLFKIPAGAPCPSTVFTSSESSACGIDLELKKEYLLAGTVLEEVTNLQYPADV